MDTAIKVKNVFKTYQMGEVGVEVLKDINVTIRKGEFLSIMGPSGSGKSTLLYLIGGLDKPTSGDIYINGSSITNMNDKMGSKMRRRDIGFVFQFYNLIPNLNVEENILLPILLDGKSLTDYKKELDSILEVTGLSDRRKHTPRELSGGQQQRVAIARALINEPDIILADEPTGNLDTKTGKEIMEIFENINSISGKTIIQVTHSEEAASFGHRIIHVRDGRVEEI